MTEMNNTSNKIKSIMGRLDDIDQETLVEMLSITDNVETGGNTDTSTMLEESKNQVLTFMTEIKELSESQEAITESLRSWFQSLRAVDGFLEGERQLQPIAPERRDVYDALQKIVEECAVRTEQAASLHNDVAEFLRKQMAQYKSTVSLQNDEIRRLSEIIERGPPGRQRKKKHKQEKNRTDETRLARELESQLRTIEEQKETIEKLRQDLQKSEVSRVALEAGTSLEESRRQTLQKASAASSQVYEAEARLVFFKERIEKLEEDNKRLNKKLNESKMVINGIQKRLDSKEARVKELEAANKKNLQLLMLEREKDGQSDQSIGIELPEPNDELMLKVAQLKEDIRAMKNDHLMDIVKQSEAMRAKFLIEKRQVLDAVEDREAGTKVRIVVDDYESKMDKQKEDFDTLNEAIVRQFGAKVLLLTKQYESRIRALNATHQSELIAERNRLKFELKKKELDLEEQYNLKVIEADKNVAVKSRKLIEEAEELRGVVAQVQLDNNKYKQVIEGFLMVHPEYKEDLGCAIHTDQFKRELSSPRLAPDGITMQEHEVRLGCLREELEGQTQWLLDQEKHAFERQLDRIETAHQSEIRGLMTKIQGSLSQCLSEGETAVNLADAIEKISDVFVKMNEHHELEGAVQEPMIPLQECDNRMKELKEKIHVLLTKFGDPEQSALISEFLHDGEESETVQELKERIRVLESVQQGDYLKEIENLRAEISARDAIINAMKSSGWPKHTGELRESLVFHYQGDDDEIPPKIPIQRSTPEFVTLNGDDSTNATSSQDFTGESQRIDLGTKKVPETVPVILALKNQSKSLFVKTLVGSDTKAAKSKKKYGQHSMVEIATKLSLRTESVFSAMDASDSKAIKVDVQRRWKPDFPPKEATHKKELRVSRLIAINVPERIVEMPKTPSKVVPHKDGRSFEFRVLVDFEYVPPPVIPSPDPETVDAIQQLEDAVTKTSSESSHVDKEKMFTEMRIAMIDARNKIIARQKAIIDELMNREPIVIHDTQIVTIEDEDSEGRKEEVEIITPRQTPPSKPRSIEMTGSIEIVNSAESPLAVYDRPPPTPVVIDLNEEDVDIDSVEDPFTAAVQLIAANLRFMSNFADNEEHISRTMRNDADAYEAFLSATQNTEEAHASFVSQLKETQQCFNENVTQLNQFHSMQNKLLEMLKISKRKAKELMDIIQDFKTAETNSRLKKQQHLLKNLTSDANEGAHNKQLLILDRLFASLQFVNQMKVTLTPENVAVYNKLLERISDMRNVLSTKKAVPQKDIEDLIDDANAFVSFVKPDGSPSMNDVLSMTTMSEVRSAQRKVKKLNTILGQLEKQLESEKEKSKSLNEQLESLKSRLSDEKDINESTISRYQTQIQVLKDALKSITESSEASSAHASNVVNSVRDEILSLHALLEASVSERDLFKERASDLEDQIVARDEHITYLNQQVESTTNVNRDLETENRNLRETIMFHEADMENLRQEREADRALSQQYRHQLETTLGKNSELHTRVNGLESRKHELKDHIGELQEATEYYEVNLALGNFNTEKTSVVSTATQTVPPIPPKPKRPPTPEDSPLLEEPPNDGPDQEPVEADPEESEHEEAEVDDIELLLRRPILSQRRPKTASDRVKTPRKQQTPVFVPLKVSIQNTDERHLAIGATKQGQRQLPGQKGPVRPTVTARAAMAMKAGGPQQGRMNTIQTTRHYKVQERNGPITKPAASSRPTSAKSHGYPACLDEEPVETIRITRVKYVDPEKEESEPKPPIIAPVSRFAGDCDPMSVAGGVPRLLNGVDVEQLSRLAVKLQKRAVRLQQSLSKKDDLVIELKRKLAEFTRQNQRLEVDCTRYQDRAKRVEIRLSHIQARLDIVMKELELQEDTEAILRKEIMRLKLSAAPAKEPLARLQKARAEQDRLKQEKRQKKAVLAATKTAIDRVGNRNVREHLEHLMGNTERSIARLEAKKRMWQNMERKNILSALSAVSLLNDEQANAVFPVRQIASMQRDKLLAIQDAWLSRKHMSGEESVHITTPRQSVDDSVQRQTVTSYSKTLEMIDRLDLPPDEQARVLKGDMTPEIVEQLNKMEEADRERPSLSMASCIQPAGRSPR